MTEPKKPPTFAQVRRAFAFLVAFGTITVFGVQALHDGNWWQGGALLVLSWSML